MTANVSLPYRTSNYDTDIEYLCAQIVHIDTGKTIMNYKKLANDPVVGGIWTKALGKEFGSLGKD